MHKISNRERLDRFARTLVAELVERDPRIRQGTVLTPGVPTYLRLDCGPRALAYLRVRPRRLFLRIDVTGLWSVPRGSSIGVPNAAGAITLLVASEAQLREARDLLLEIVAVSLGPPPGVSRAA